MKSRLKSKTYWFALILAAFGPLVDNIELLKPYMNGQAFAIFTIVSGIIVAVLREVTKEPIGRETLQNVPTEAGK